MYRSLGMDLHGCAQFLHVSARTVHNWESGKYDIPYATYRLMRLLNFMGLSGKAGASLAASSFRLKVVRSKARTVAGGGCCS
ncbi:helix-turn-helix domain-containing protein [Comamonas testosteroni]|uniref:hypothetical protein n=1 Tax=Comamonas testosteroni TaxID=285 RepID=UPI0023AA4E2F|nr:hypothetical protein [Comamonas testosteroni]WEE75278.1 helix-turn-helix domain-containing protein [Comamonas testosteroni]